MGTKTTDSLIIELDNRFNRIFEQFCCSVCLNEINIAFITTKCAHRFCEECIRKTIEQYHKCPLCNKFLNYDDIIRDAQFDSLKDELKIFREEKMNLILDKIIESVSETTKPKPIELTPLENVLKNHLIKTLKINEDYVIQFKSHFQKEIERIDRKTIELIETFEKSFSDRTEIEMNTKNVIKAANIEKANLEEALTRQINSVAKKYENQMTPLSLPAELRIKIMCKKLQINGLILKPNEDINIVYNYLVKQTDIAKDRIIDFDLNRLDIICFGPFSSYNFEEAQLIYDEFKISGKLPNYAELISPKNSFPILEHNLKPNSELIFYGKILFESDLPKQCFKYTFDKVNLKPVDYFQCIDCGIKCKKKNFNSVLNCKNETSSYTIGICKSCIEKCHIDSGHQIRSFSLNHNATWACCKCDNNDCKLVESNQ